MVVPLQLSVVLFLVWPNKALILLQGVLTPASQIAEERPTARIYFSWLHSGLESEVWSVSSPLGEVFKAKPQFVVMAKQLWVLWNVGEKDLRHLKGTL